MMNIRKYIVSDARTILAMKNVVASVGIKGIDIIVQLLLVPVTLGYLTKFEYGVWITLSTLLYWVNAFDIGLSNGLRNKLAESLARGDIKAGKHYVSTALIILPLLAVFVAIVGSIIISYVDWYSILNINPLNLPDLYEIIVVVFSMFCAGFAVKILGSFYLALQLPAVSNALNTIGNIVALIIICILKIYTPGNLLYVALAFSSAPIIVYGLAYPVTFRKFYSNLSPSIHYYKRSYVKSLVSVGWSFFLLQIAGIILFAFSNLLISHEFGAEEVTPYNIAFRYYSVINMLMGLISAPMWSATTDAYTKNDISWIKKSIRKMLFIILFFVFVLLIMTLCSNLIYSLWVGPNIHIPIEMSALMACYIIVLMVSTTFSNMLNGMGKLKLQTIMTLLEAALFVPICLTLSRSIGINGILLGMIIVNGLGMTTNILQFTYYVRGHKKE